MTYLLIAYATMWFSFALACPPTLSPGGGGAATTAAATTTAKAKKREVDQIQVTVVSNQKYDPAMNESHMQVFKSLLNDYMKARGATYNKDMVQEKIVNVDGNFAVLYIVTGYDCDGLNNFLHDAKSSANFIKDIKVKCDGRPQFVVA